MDAKDNNWLEVQAEGNKFGKEFIRYRDISRISVTKTSASSSYHTIRVWIADTAFQLADQCVKQEVEEIVAELKRTIIECLKS